MITHLYFAAIIAQANPVVRYFYHIFHKDPFRGLYRANAFDLSILIPYFTILTFLALFGLHRYHLTYLFLKNRRKTPKAPKPFDKLPRITVQLPIYNERYVVERLL
jgi:hypothetical protein